VCCLDGTVVSNLSTSIEREEGTEVYIYISYTYMYDKNALVKRELISSVLRITNTQRNEEIFEAWTQDLSEHYRKRRNRIKSAVKF